MAYGAADTAGTALPVAAYPASSQAMRDAESTATGMVPLIGAAAGPPPTSSTVQGIPPSWPSSPAPWPTAGPSAANSTPSRPGTPTTSRHPSEADTHAFGVGPTSGSSEFMAGATPWPSTGVRADDRRGRTENAPNGVVVSVSRRPDARGRVSRESGATVTHIAHAASAAERSVQPTSPAPRLRDARRGSRVESHLGPVHAPGRVQGQAAVEAPTFAPEVRTSFTPPAGSPTSPATESYGTLPLWGAPASTAAPATSERPVEHADHSDGRAPTPSGPTPEVDRASAPEAARRGQGGFARLTRATGATEPFAIAADRVVLTSAISLVVLAAFGVASGVLTTALSTVSPTAYLTATWMLDFLVVVVALITSFFGVVGYLRTERTNLVAFGAAAVGGFVAVLQVTALILSMVQTAIFR